MSLLVLLAAAALATPPGHEPIGSVKGDDPSKPFRIDPVGLRVIVDERGKAAAITCLPKTSPPLCPVLTKAVSTWDFTPGQRDGRPARVEVVMSLDLAAAPKPGGFGVQVLNALLSLAGPADDESDTRRTPPVYPVEDMKRGRGGVVLFEVARDATGEHYRVLRSWFNGEPVTRRNTLVDAATKAVKTWPVAPLSPEQQTTCLKIEFSLGSKLRAAPPGKNLPCQEAYVAGFAMPVLLTDVTKAPL